MNERKIVVADPTALGLFGLAMVTLVASSQKLGLTDGTALIIPWAIFLGAFAQLYASIQDAKKNNVFGATAFGAYAFFWFAVALTWLIQAGVLGEKLAKQADIKQLGFAFVGYLIFSIFMTIGAMEVHKVLFFIFVFIDLLFVGLSLSTLDIAPAFGHKLAAYSELIISLIAFYGSAAAVLNAHFNKKFLPVGKPFNIFNK
ncbi:MAG: hypothetical protein CVU84_00960 [Firmicutes bacterium HGW-Firmicutes-1]|jgi:hypothetical protein|nr:MAG: hypothetical protein CVU84_00960 [Firmicutes bacterium HGW-Firmicutes-1]